MKDIFMYIIWYRWFITKWSIEFYFTCSFNFDLKSEYIMLINECFLTLTKELARRFECKSLLCK